MIACEARVPAFAKLNLDLRVLYKRPDGFHELRSVFQTISLADDLLIRVRPSRRAQIAIGGNIDIPDNLVVRAARLCLDEMKISASVEFELQKRIPMGAGLGGGSSDAAAVLLALPPMAGKPIPFKRSLAIAAQLGSDVPFFLLGGTAVVLGRGEEVYPITDLRAAHVLLVSPGVHVSTAEAYAALSPRLTPESAASKLASFTWNTWSGLPQPAVNDFEPVVFEQHPRLKTIRDRLQRAGATTAMMTGSGSSIFGIFPDRAKLAAARPLFKDEQVSVVRFVTRANYRKPREIWNLR